MNKTTLPRCRTIAWPLVLLASGLPLACSREQPARQDVPSSADKAAVDRRPAPRKYLIERVDDIAVAQVYADGFAELSLRDKQLCFHLAQSAIAGRDIFIDQKYEHGLEIRDLLETFYVLADKFEAEVAAELRRYTKLFWLHNGIHHAYSTKKNILKLSQAQYDNCLRIAREAGHKLPSERRLILLYEAMTDPLTDSSCTNKSPGDGKDPLLSSCNNLYHDVGLTDLEGFTEKYPLNSRLVKKAAGSFVEEVYRAGDGDKIPAGRYATQLTKVIEHLRAALPFAPEKTRKALSLLIRYYQTGEPKDWHAYNVAWVEDADSVVDMIQGFVEVYVDARGAKGAWEAVVSFMAPARGKQIRTLAENAQWFEDRMPWDPEFRKPQVRGIHARAITVVTETGDSGPFTPIGINLPNEADIRQQHGSKSVMLSNVVEAYNALSGGASLQEFAWDQAEIDRARRHGDAASDILTNLHEVVGHASGQIRSGISTQRLGVYYSTLEEGRADLVGLYWIADPKLRELGIVTDADVALAEYEAYARNALVQLRRVKLGDRVEEDHMRNRQMVVLWMIANSNAIKVEQRDGKTFYRVTGIKEFRDAAGRLLGEVMRIKATGDFAAGKKLVDTYGTKVDPTLHAEILKRLEPLNLPSATGFVQPELRLIKGDDGGVTDVEVHYPMNLADQMLRWSGRK